MRKWQIARNLLTLEERVAMIDLKLGLLLEAVTKLKKEK